MKKRKVIDRNLDRIMDANFNRSKEGLRVCEDVCRFIFDAPEPARQYKNIRHRLTELTGDCEILALIKARNVNGDVGRKSSPEELDRRGAIDIFYANSQRVKESLRVLEEFAKLRGARLSGSFKKLRYKVYALEKCVVS